MSEKSLLPCPFCGGEAELFRRTSVIGDFVEVRCKTCKAKTDAILFDARKHPNDEEYDEAAEAWNTRKPVEAVLERLEAECIKYKNEWNAYDDEVAFGQMNGMSNAISIIKEVLMLEVEE